jgi:type IV secretory pathway VirB2 component (pilin)
MNSDLESAGTSVFAAAIQWLDGVLLGTLASTVAVIALASVGLLMLSGRVDVRRGAQVIIGCFIVFGASTIAAGIMGVIGGTGSAPQTQSLPSPPPLYPAAPAQPARGSSPYDPYAGAALPPRR